MPDSQKRFRVAFSFAGEKRDYVAHVASLIAARFGESAVLYDKYHEAEFARHDLGLYLPKLYHEESDLIVVVVCQDYQNKEWCGLEWNAIFGLLKKRKIDEVMFCRYNLASVDGLYLAGFIELDDKSPQQTATLILQRLAGNEGKPRDHYTTAAADTSKSDNSAPESKADPIPKPPAFYAEPPYIGRHEFFGRAAQLETLDDWAAPADPHPVLLYEAIGGMGKSMLTWEWTTKHATEIRGDWAGRFWYSFYEKGAIMADFCQRALAYMTERPLGDFRKKKTLELTDMLLHQLRDRPWLLVLDGLERVLVAYHRFDAAQITDEEANSPTDRIAQRDPCSAIRPEDDDLLRALAGAAPSKLLLTSRLVPRILLNQANQPIPGVLRDRLPGLRPADAEALIRSCGVTGSPEDIQTYLRSHCDCHPLVTGVLAGLINDYLPDRGNFDKWAADPEGGGRLNLADLDLVQKRNHILLAALAALPEKNRQLLSTLALLSEAVDVPTIMALNPHLPPEPDEVSQPDNPELEPWWNGLPDDQKQAAQDDYRVALQHQETYEEVIRLRLQSAEYRNAPIELKKTIQDLERRGLLHYDSQARHYDLHPVVRGIAAGGMQQEERERYGQHVVDHFSRQAHNPYEDAETLDDVRFGIYVVRTLLQMGQETKALGIFNGDLSTSLLFNLEAYGEVLSLAKPLFTRGWTTLSGNLDESKRMFVANHAGIALFKLNALDESLTVFGAALVNGIDKVRLGYIGPMLANVAVTFISQGRFARATQHYTALMDIANIENDQALIFAARLGYFGLLTRMGKSDEAESLWQLLDPMGREWDRSRYRPGDAESEYGLFLFYLGKLSRDHIEYAEKLARTGKNRGGVRKLLSLRGKWQLEQGNCALVVEDFQEAVGMAREVNRIDADSETLLALAKHKIDQLPDPHQEAERLASLRSPRTGPWQTYGTPLGMTGRPGNTLC